MASTPQHATPGTIPLQGDGSLVPTRNRRWAESFGIALCPFIGVTVCRFIIFGFSPAAISPVELSFAMLSAAAVLSVQLMDAPLRTRPGVVPTLVFVVIFAVTFTAAAIVTTANVEDHRTRLASATDEAVSTLKRLDVFLQGRHLASPGALAHLEDRITAVSNDAATTGKAVKADYGFTRELILTLLLAVFFLAYVLVAWSRL